LVWVWPMYSKRWKADNLPATLGKIRVKNGYNLATGFFFFRVYRFDL